MIDFKKLDRADIWIASEEPTPEGDKAFSEFLKAYKAKEAQSKKGTPVPAIRPAVRPATRKKPKVAAR
jgi:hypothetical protein